jgi:GntR family transcriptional regulator
VRAASADQTVSATLAGPDVADALGVEIGSALIAMTRVVRDEEGKGVEFLSALYRPDKHQFHMALKREGEGAERHWRPAVSNAVLTPSRQHTGRRGPGQRRKQP